MDYIKMTSCPHCGATIPRSLAACKGCGRQRTHRDCYPEQYKHPLVGKTVYVRGHGVAVVERVTMSERWGQMVHLVGINGIAYRISDCAEVQL